MKEFLHKTMFPMAPVLFLVILSGCKESSLETHLYIWQRVWTPAVCDAVAKRVAAVDSLMVFGGWIESSDTQWGFSHTKVEWGILKDTGKPITLVFRAHTEFDKYLDESAISDTTKKLLANIDNVFQNAETNGVLINGIQLDYDCPTSKLSRYENLINNLTAQKPECKFSITALPTWLGNEEFAKLVKQLSYYVLQVHSFESPNSKNEKLTVCNTENIGGYIAKALKLKVPYYLSLPTYGYRVVFDDKGEFIALEAEGGNNIWPPSYDLRDVMVDPVDIASLVADIKSKRPKYMKGIVWFRLPVETDRYCWDWSTLEKVMAGQAPEILYKAEIRTPEPALSELWISDKSNSVMGNQLKVTIERLASHIIAADCVNGFEIISSDMQTISLTGPAPSENESVMVYWMRYDDKIAKEDIKTSVLKVEKL